MAKLDGIIPPSIFESSDEDHPIMKVLKAVGMGATNFIGEVRHRRQEREDQQAAMVAQTIRAHPEMTYKKDPQTGEENQAFNPDFAKYASKFFSPDEVNTIRLSHVVSQIDKLRSPSANQPLGATGIAPTSGTAATVGTPQQAADTVTSVQGFGGGVEPPYNPPPAQGPPASAGPYATAPTTTSTIPPPAQPVATAGARTWPVGLPQATQPFTLTAPTVRPRTVADDLRDTMSAGTSQSFYDKDTGERFTINAPTQAESDTLDYYKAYEQVRQSGLGQGLPPETASYLAHTTAVGAFDEAGRLVPPAAREIADARTTGAIKLGQKKAEIELQAAIDRREAGPLAEARARGEARGQGITLRSQDGAAGEPGAAGAAGAPAPRVYDTIAQAKAAEEVLGKSQAERAQPLKADADRWYYPEGHPKAGTTVPASMTMQQALDLGAVPVSVEAKNHTKALAGSVQHLKDLRDATQHFFKDVHDEGDSMKAFWRMYGAAHNVLATGPDRAWAGKLESAKANILQLLRSLGEKGNIAAVIIEKAEGASIGNWETNESVAGKLSFFNGLLSAMRRSDGIPLQAHEKALFNSIDAIWSDAIEHSTAVQDPKTGAWDVTLTPAAQDAITRRIPVIRDLPKPPPGFDVTTGQASAPAAAAPAGQPAAPTTGDPELDQLLAQ